jgi:hypothetical protein
MTPIVNGVHSYAVVYLDRKEIGAPEYVTNNYNILFTLTIYNTFTVLHSIIQNRSKSESKHDIHSSRFNGWKRE